MTPLIVWSHDPFTVKHDVLLHPSVLPNSKPGDFAELVAINSDGERRTLCFQIGPTSDSPNVQISVSSSLLSSLGIQPRSTVQVKLKTQKAIEMDTVEIRFKGAYLTRADLYRISKQITFQCIRVGQRISFLGGSLRLQVDTLWRGGKRKFSGYIGPDTNIVYRSDSARIILLVQLSVEMWDFDETGEIGFQKLVESFIPEALRRWKEQGAQHTITIILFTSLSGSSRKSRLLPGELEPKPQNYYRVAVDVAPVQGWADILSTLRREFINFKSVLMGAGDRLANQPLPASKGNLLDALKYTTSFTASKFTDRDLCRTNLQVVVITASPGLFDVDESEMYQVSKLVLSVDLGVELICLSRPPLHLAPMFRAKTRDNKLEHYIPTWINVSFWGPTERYIKQWIPRAKIYDIQMMGVMENEMKAISVKHLPQGRLTTKFMRKYDSNIFKAPELEDEEHGAQDIAAAPQQGNNAPFLSVQAGSPSRPATLGCDKLLPPSVSGPTAAPVFVGGSTKSEAAVSAVRSVSHTSSAVSKPAENTLRSSLGALLRSSNKTLRKKESTTSLLQSPTLSVASTDVPTRKRAQSRSIPIPKPKKDGGSSHYHEKPRNQGFREPAQQHEVQRTGVNDDRSQLQPILSNSPTPKKLSPANPVIKKSASCSTTKDATASTAQRCMWRKLKSPSLVDYPTRVEAFGRWAFTYPKGARRTSINWNSLNSPASLPLSSQVFPTLTEFNNDYKFQFYDLAIIPDDNAMSARQILDELIGSRLQMGFQIAIGDAVAKVESVSTRGNPSLLKQIIPADNFVGVRLYMIREDTIHRLCIEQEDLINIRIYTLNDSNNPLAKAKSHYKPDTFLRTKYDSVAHKLQQEMVDPVSEYKINWNLADQQLVGLVDHFDTNFTSYARSVRFVIIPVPSSNTEVESQRIEGILKTVNLIVKHQVDRSSRSLSSDVVFYTGFIHHAAESLFLESMESKVSPPQSDRLNKSVGLEELRNGIQSKWGVKFHTKKWHWRTYKDVFIGDAFVNWIMHNFSDITSRDDATKFAQSLMDQEFIERAESNSKVFIDGFYFYRLIGDRGSASTHGSTGSVSTVATSIVNNSSGSGKASQAHDAAGAHSNSADANAKKTHISLTRAIYIDLDPKNVSARPENCRIHVDRFHNPEHAFNLQAEWLNATPRLLDDLFNAISRLCNNYCLRLVQVPNENIASADKNSPFRSSTIAKFCIDPLKVVANKAATDMFPLYFHHYFLKRIGFVFDGAGLDFSHDRFQLDYSWKSGGGSAQYIHHTGAVIVQILKDSSFYIAPNNIFLSRYVSGPAPQVGVEDQVQSMFVAICQNEHALQEIFHEAAQNFDTSPAQTPPPSDNTV